MKRILMSGCQWDDSRGPGWERDGDPVLPHSQKSAHLRRQVAYFRLGLTNTMASGALGSRNWLSFPLGEATHLHGTLDCPQLGQGRGLGTIPPFWPGSPPCSACSTCSTRFGTAAFHEARRPGRAGDGSGAGLLVRWENFPGQCPRASPGSCWWQPCSRRAVWHRFAPWELPALLKARAGDVVAELRETPAQSHAQPRSCTPRAALPSHTHTNGVYQHPVTKGNLIQGRVP